MSLTYTTDVLFGGAWGEMLRIESQPACARQVLCHCALYISPHATDLNYHSDSHPFSTGTEHTCVLITLSFLKQEPFKEAVGSSVDHSCTVLRT